MDYSEYVRLSDAEQRAHDGVLYDAAPVLDPRLLEAAIREDMWGRASLSDILCKLWRWVIKVAKAVISGVKEVLKDLTAAAFELLDDLLGSAGSLFKNNPIILLILAGLGLWAASSLGLFGDDEDKDPDPPSAGNSYSRTDAKDTAKTVAANYYTAGAYGALKS